MENAGYRKLTLCEVVDILTVPRDTLILHHVHPDGDAIGSAFALREILGLSGSRAFCVCPDQIPDRLRFVVAGRQESTLAEDIPKDFISPRIIAVDTAAPQQLGKLFDVYGGHIELMIDHHSSGTPFADNYIIPEASAAGEIVYDIASEFIRRGIIDRLNKYTADCLYAAMSSDTGCFRFSNATPGTYRRAAALIECGIDSSEINHLLFEVKSKETMLAESAGVNRIEYFHNGKMAVITIPYELKQKLGLRDEHFETLVDIARAPEGVCIAAVIRQPDNSDTYRVSMRSSCDFDVSEICRVFGGGGHVRAAGCTLHCADISEAVSVITSEVGKNFEKNGCL